MVDVRSSSRQTSQKGRDASGTAASEPTMHPSKRAERFISQKDCFSEALQYATGTVRGSHAIADDRREPHGKKCQAVYSPPPNTP